MLFIATINNWNYWQFNQSNCLSIRMNSSMILMTKLI